MSNGKNTMAAGRLQLKTIDSRELASFSRNMKVSTFVKVKEDVKRSQKNVERARKLIAR
jgi:hypothetical protein